MPDAPTPDMIKRMRVDEEDTGTRSPDPPPKLRKATVEDVDEDGDQRMEDEEFAPGNDADYFAEEDEEGRFFGGVSPLLREGTFELPGTRSNY